MQELKELAKKLLADGKVKVVIGYEEGPRGPRPAFVTTPAEAEKLVFNPRCVQNLATYLSPRRTAVKALGRPAVVVKGCDSRAVAGLIRETQLKREDVEIIGVRCGGVVRDPASAAPLSAETVADKCARCDIREPKLVDHLVGALPPEPPARAGAEARDARISELEGRSPSERWAWWQEQLSHCIRCHACREVCPMCFCERCIADMSQPQWVETSSHPRANLAWNITRAMHLAGRCVDCGECERVCPAGIRIGLLNRKIATIVEARFAHRPTDDPGVPSPIGAFRLDDEQEFIL